MINSDTPDASRRLKEITGISLPVLLERELAVARSYDFLPRPEQPMGGMTGVPQMGFVIMNGKGIIRVQRVDTYFGRHAGQMLEIVRRLAKETPRG